MNTMIPEYISVDACLTLDYKRDWDKIFMTLVFILENNRQEEVFSIKLSI